jgi:hypothetical protein
MTDAEQKEHRKIKGIISSGHLNDTAVVGPESSVCAEEEWSGFSGLPKWLRLLPEALGQFMPPAARAAKENSKDPHDRQNAQDKQQVKRHVEQKLIRADLHRVPRGNEFQKSELHWRS